MEDFDRKKHWEQLYETTDTRTKSWFQPVPRTSLTFFKEHQIPYDAKIIDIGGGDSHLVDQLMDRGYQNITVMDISEAAIAKAKKRLADRSVQVTWMVADAGNFQPGKVYDVWHDRAAFHFLTKEADISHYVNTAQQCIRSGGLMTIGTFSKKGPKKCSGIEIQQYSADAMVQLFSPFFESIKCENIDHETPAGALQNFVFCQFRRKHKA